MATITSTPTPTAAPLRSPSQRNSACPALGRRLLRLLRLQLGHALAVEADEIHRIDTQRREAAVHHRARDDLAREREQEARTFDHHDRMQVLLRNVLHAEHTRIDQ